MGSAFLPLFGAYVLGWALAWWARGVTSKLAEDIRLDADAHRRRAHSFGLERDRLAFETASDDPDGLSAGQSAESRVELGHTLLGLELVEHRATRRYEQLTSLRKVEAELARFADARAQALHARPLRYALGKLVARVKGRCEETTR